MVLMAVKTKIKQWCVALTFNLNSDFPGYLILLSGSEIGSENIKILFQKLEFFWLFCNCFKPD